MAVLVWSARLLFDWFEVEKMQENWRSSVAMEFCDFLLFFS